MIIKLPSPPSVYNIKSRVPIVTRPSIKKESLRVSKYVLGKVSLWKLGLCVMQE